MARLTRGAKNLIILGAAAIAIALTTTSISLAIYRDSGDIYIDRSRPGFLPDEEELEKDSSTTVNDFTFPESGTLDVPDLYTYEKNFQSELEEVNDYGSAFSESELSDGTLGLPE